MAVERLARPDGKRCGMLPNVPRNTKSAAPADAAPVFETALAELEAIVLRLERGDQSLEQSLADFERAVNLAASCQDALASAELKVRVLTQQGGVARLEAFDEGPGPDP